MLLLKRKVFIIISVLLFFILKVHTIQCGSCLNCQIVNIKNQCLKCFDGYQLNSATNQCIKIQQFRRVVSIIFDENISNLNRTLKPRNIGTSADKNMENLTGNNSQTIIKPDQKNLKNYIISTIIDSPRNEPLKLISTIQSASFNLFTVDINCIKYQGRICKKCEFRYVLFSGQCRRVGSGCSTWNQIGKCLTCYEGYSLNDKGDCLELQISQALPNNLVIQPVIKSALNCQQIGHLGVCIKCIFRYYLINGVCNRVSDLCKDWNKDTGACTSCDENFILLGNSCVVNNLQIQSTQSKTSTTSTKIDILSNQNFKLPKLPPPKTLVPNCSEFAADGSCIKCAYRHYKANNQCRPINSDCKSWNTQNGGCTQCYNEFELKQSQCVQKMIPQFKPIIFVPPPIKGCAELTPEGICQKCALRFVLINGLCTNVIDECQRWQVTTGYCRQCYEGYRLDGIKCIKQETKEKQETIVKPQAISEQILTLDDIKLIPKRDSQEDFEKGQVLFMKNNKNP